MAHLVPIPFPILVRRLRREIETRDAAFDLPRRKWFIPDPSLDFSAAHHDHRPATPLGPAAGPHTQLAQNIVLAWLAGARIMELKTVQVNDRLEIPRPCIHAPNVGYNVEWSQELRVEESVREYAKAHFLIGILRASRVFGRFPVGLPLETAFDVSVGYDLEGIRSEKVTGFLRSMLDAGPVLDELRAELPAEFATYRDLDLSPRLSNCVTLSTFHGCPSGEIEAIAGYLLEEIGVHTLLKLNPTLLGFDEVRNLLVDRLGYGRIVLRPEAFAADLRYEDGLAMVHRLKRVAEDQGSTIGVKFTNTLVVQNDPGIFPTQADPSMYLSGAPLHVIAMTLMQRFREDAGFEFPASFSGGIDAVNFPDAVACGLVPVTTCTDLLKQGGYGRLPAYLKALGRAMSTVGVSNRDAYVLAVRGRASEALRETLAAEATSEAQAERLLADLEPVARTAPDALPDTIRAAAAGAGLDGDAVLLRAVRTAGRLNGREIVPPLGDAPRYHRSRNEKTPRSKDRILALYDCINCDLCIAVCPNDAMFAYELPPLETATVRYEAAAGGMSTGEGLGYRRSEVHQLAVYADACNECSNCEVFCPETGAPFEVKERWFSRPETFETSTEADGFLVDGPHLRCRVGGIEYRLRRKADSEAVAFEGGGVRGEFNSATLKVMHLEGEAGTALDTAVLLRALAAWEGIRAGCGYPDPG